MADFDINSPGDTFDSRDVIERWEELESTHTDLQNDIDEAAEHVEVSQGQIDDTRAKIAAMEEAGDLESDDYMEETGNLTIYENELAENMAALKEAETAMEQWDEAEEYFKLKEFVAEGESYAEDWLHGAQFIADDYFEEYAQELAEDLGAVKRNVEWPYTCIDWERAARELKSDYTAVEIDGKTYWVR